MFRSTLLNQSLDQDAIFRAMNVYFTLNGKTIPLENCHGCACVWLKLRFQGCAHVYKKIAETIVEYPKEKIGEIGKVIEAFYKDIQNGQTRQLETQEVLDEKKSAEDIQDKCLDEASFLGYLSKSPALCGFLIRSCTVKKHTVAVYRNKDECEVFDSNYLSAEAKKCALKDVFSELKSCFYTSFNLVQPVTVVPFQIEIIIPRPRLLAEYPRLLLWSKDGSSSSRDLSLAPMSVKCTPS